MYPHGREGRGEVSKPTPPPTPTAAPAPPVPTREVTIPQPEVIKVAAAPRSEAQIPRTPAGQPVSTIAVALEATPSTTILGRQTTDKNLGLWQRIITFFTGLFQKNPFRQTIAVGEKTYRVEVVSSPADMALGLAKYDHLEANQAMLFELTRKSTPGFWMKNMQFDIDIVWLRDNLVIGVSQGYAATPFTLIYPPSPVDSVLEVNLNSGIKVGDRVKIDS